MAKLDLYNGQRGNRPDQQEWLAYGTNNTSTCRQTLGSVKIGSETIRFTNLNTSYGTSATTARAGYSNYQPFIPTLKNSSFPELSSGQGFNLTLRLKINSEIHSGDDNGDGLIDRAGFAVILLDSDQKGIELGFWTDEIWAQQDGSNLFTHSPSERAFLSTSQWVSYDLLALNNTYYLSANSNVILQGSIKDYRTFDHIAAGLPYNPYKQPNLLFLGDNTSRASSSTDLARIVINSADLNSSGNDNVTGGSADDVINGGAGNDILHGGGGSDVLIGGDGIDWLNGGSGSDRLFGQGNADRFLFDSGAAFRPSAFGIDTLMDFVSADGDRVVLDKTSFTALISAVGNGFSVAREFANVASIAEGASRRALIVYDRSSGGLFYNQNGTASGFGSGGQFASLLGTPSLTAGDFVIQA